MTANTGPARILRDVVTLIAVVALAWSAGCRSKDETSKKDRPGYLETVVKTRDLARTAACQQRLASLWRSLEQYAVTNNGSLPASRDEFIKTLGLSPEMLRCPGPDKQEYSYIPGQRTGMAKTNVVLYEQRGDHEDKCFVLRMGGQVKLLSPGAVSTAADRTRNGLGR